MKKNTSRWALFALLSNIAALGTLWYFGLPAHAQTQIPSSFSRPDQARFRLVAEEGIVQPDGRTYVSPLKVWTVSDKASGQCYLLFFTGSGTAASGPIACP